jgi:hypothetical protein
MGRARAAAAAAVAVLTLGASAVAASTVTLRAGGVAVKAPAGWALVTVADPGAVTDPRTVLVAGTEGAAPRKSDCQVAAYRVPADGAVVVVLRWAGRAPEWLPTDRAALDDLRLRRPYFECFEGRGAGTQLAIRGRAYQVNVMAGDRATPRTVANALAVARSLDVPR